MNFLLQFLQVVTILLECDVLIFYIFSNHKSRNIFFDMCHLICSFFCYFADKSLIHINYG